MLVKFLSLVKYFLILKTHRPVWGCCFKRDDLLGSRAEQGNEKNLYFTFFLLCINFQRLKTLICDSPHWALLLFSNMRWFPSLCFHPAPQGAPKPPSQCLHGVLPKAVPTLPQPWATTEKQIPFFSWMPSLGLPRAHVPQPCWACLASQNLSYTRWSLRSLPKATSTGCQVGPKATKGHQGSSLGEHNMLRVRLERMPAPPLRLFLWFALITGLTGSEAARAQSHLAILDPLRVHFPHHSYCPEGPTGTKRVRCTLQKPERLCGDLNCSENIFEIFQLRWFYF